MSDYVVLWWCYVVYANVVFSVIILIAAEIVVALANILVDLYAGE